MSKAPSMPMFWDAYLADTTHLTTEEHGAYMLLLAAMWRRNGWVPDDDRDNARILGLSAVKWRRIKARLATFLIMENDQLSQKKLLETWKITQEKISKNKTNGAKGGHAKANKNKELPLANGIETLGPKATIPEPEPEPERKKEQEIVKTALPLSLESPQVVSPLADAVTRYNQAAEKAGWPKVQKLTPTRSKQLRARLKDCDGLQGWEEALRKAFASDFCRARTSKPWSGFSFDWLIKSVNFIKLIEGNYDNKTTGATGGDSAAWNPNSGTIRPSIQRRIDARKEMEARAGALL